MKNHKQEEESRRSFIQRLTQVLAYGGLTHFAFSKLANADESSTPGFISCPGGRSGKDDCKINSKGVETDRCPGGGPAEDVCLPAQGLKDECPGERWPQDECPPSGDRAEDVCNTGLPEADVCDPVILIGGESPDQCPAQNASTDVCRETDAVMFDVCWSGLPNDDACAPDGGFETDECPGGGSDVDTCTSESAGDACTPDSQYPGNADDCKSADLCGLDETPDRCSNGTNSHTGIGDDDVCGYVSEKAGYASDTCLDGSADQDLCDGSLLDNSGRPEEDVCIVKNAKETGTEDICHPDAYSMTHKGSDDYCYLGLPPSDVCNPSVGDMDECPGGITEADECLLGAYPEDECPGGKSDVDFCFLPEFDTDECTGDSAGQEDAESPDRCNGREIDQVE